MNIKDIRDSYHTRICKEIVRTREHNGHNYPNFADGSNKSSCLIAQGIIDKLPYSLTENVITEQTAGSLFESITREFIANAFELLQHLRPGKWIYDTIRTTISQFEQYEHLKGLEDIIKEHENLRSALGGDYIVKPDIVIGRTPLEDNEINSHGEIIKSRDHIAEYTPLRKENSERNTPLLHAVISCKWTIRSDRSQNTRTEALNLIRNRKGHVPHIVAVSAEPLPTRLAALAMGTGDIDCVYHFALFELQQTIEELKNQDQMDILKTMVEGKRLRDISDLPFDLAI